MTRRQINSLIVTIGLVAGGGVAVLICSGIVNHPDYVAAVERAAPECFTGPVGPMQLHRLCLDHEGAKITVAGDGSAWCVCPADAGRVQVVGGAR